MVGFALFSHTTNTGKYIYKPPGQPGGVYSLTGIEALCIHTVQFIRATGYSCILNLSVTVNFYQAFRPQVIFDVKNIALNKSKEG